MNFKLAAFATVFSTLLSSVTFSANTISATHHYVVSPGTSLRAGEPGKNEFFIIGAQSNSVPHIEKQTSETAPTVASKGNTIKLAKVLKHAFHQSKSVTKANQKSFAKNRQHQKPLAKKQQAHKPLASKAQQKKQFASARTLKAKHKLIAKKATHSHTLHG